VNDASIVAIVVAFLTGAGGLITALTTKRKIDADSESISIATMKNVVLELRAELERCHTERSTFQKRIAATEKRIDSLEAYIRLNSGINPEDINGHPV